MTGSFIPSFIPIEEPTFEHQCKDVESEEYQEELHFLFIYLDRIDKQDNEREEHLDGLRAQVYQLNLFRCEASASLEHADGKPSEDVEEHRDERIPSEVMFRPPGGDGRSYCPSGYQHQQGVPCGE